MCCASFKLIKSLAPHRPAIHNMLHVKRLFRWCDDDGDSSFSSKRNSAQVSVTGRSVNTRKKSRAGVGRKGRREKLKWKNSFAFNFVTYCYRCLWLSSSPSQTRLDVHGHFFQYAKSGSLNIKFNLRVRLLILAFSRVADRNLHAVKAPFIATEVEIDSCGRFVKV